jgi:hypothetical protein
MAGIQIKRATVIDASAKTITSKAATSASRTRVDASTIADPVSLAKVLQDMQDSVGALTSGQSSNPHSAPCIVRKVSLTSGEQAVVRHSLGRPYTDWWISRVWPSPSGAFTLPKEVASNATDQSLTLLATSTNLVDITIAGA